MTLVGDEAELYDTDPGACACGATLMTGTLDARTSAHDGALWPPLGLSGSLLDLTPSPWVPYAGSPASGHRLGGGHRVVR